LLVAQYLSAQEAVSDSLSGWKHQREIGLLVNQSSFNKWLAGGTTNFSGTLNFDYNITFQDEVWLWTATADVALGFAKIDSEEFVKKTEDRLAIDAVLERKSNKRWKWSSSINLKTQNTPGYAFVEGQNNQIERIKSTVFFFPCLSASWGRNLLQEIRIFLPPVSTTHRTSHSSRQGVYPVHWSG
jgi:hypothetical protein